MKRCTEAVLIAMGMKQSFFRGRKLFTYLPSYLQNLKA